VADSLIDGEKTRHSGRSYWIVARRETGRSAPFIVTLPEGGEALPVFSFEEEAEMFLWFVENGDGWLAFEVSGGELLSILFGPRAVAQKVALDPSPEIVNEMAVGLITLSRERFVGRIVDADGRASPQDHPTQAGPVPGTPSWLPPGYGLDRSDPDVLLLRRWDGSSVAAFSARGATRAGIVEAVEDDSGLVLW
jgi:hypothetical protein